MTSAIGIDFGTTNSSIARANPDGSVDLAHFQLFGESTDSYRSLLYMELHRDHGRRVLKSWTGPAGIERYLEGEMDGRLVQSLKSFLSSKSLVTTDVFGQRRTLEQLISKILADLRESGERQFGVPLKSVVMGRPVRFVGSDNEAGDNHAVERLRNACKLAGFDDVRFELEPVAAAQYYESTLDYDELILIGDFGGGTSDFSLVQAGPGGKSRNALLGNAGVGLAGDAFDAKIIRNVVSPALGAGTSIRSIDKILPMPTWLYSNLERWHHLSFLKTKDIANLLQSLRIQSLEPEKIEALIHLIEHDCGYRLHRAVQKVKVELSSQPEAKFHFQDGDMQLEAILTRESFERWISEDLLKIEACVDDLISKAAISPKDVDMVFLTGGTSFVPAVRRIFERRFGGPSRIRSGNEFTSVARGLALSAK